MAEEWKNTKAQRAELRQKFGGRCAYCGGMITGAMHADHVEPCVRLHRDFYGKPLPKEERSLLYPDRNQVENMMPACAPCNLHKGGYSLDGWRQWLERSADILRRDTSTFRAAERFGIVTVQAKPIVFFFEEVARAESVDRSAFVLAFREALA